MNYKLGAGIVLYNPEVELLKKNVDALYNQVDKLLLYDNGSSNYQEVKSIFGNYEKIVFEDGVKNRGIAFALNKILNWANREN